MAQILLPSYSIGGNSEHSVENQAAIKTNKDFSAKCNEVAATLTDDLLLRDVYSSHLWFLCDDRWEIEEPRIHEGVPFYQVGRNSSHEFYMGTKDGKRYKADCGEEYVGRGDDCGCISKAQEVFESWKSKGNGNNFYSCAEAMQIETDCRFTHYDVIFSSREIPEGKDYGYMGHS
jgi:hypothetical protein